MSDSDTKRQQGGSNTVGWWCPQLPGIHTVMPGDSPQNAQRPNVSGAGFSRQIGWAGKRLTGATTNPQIRAHFADLVPGGQPYDRSVAYAHGLAREQQAKRVPGRHQPNRPRAPLSYHAFFWAAVVGLVVLTHR